MPHGRDQFEVARRVAAGYTATGGTAHGADLIEQRLLAQRNTHPPLTDGIGDGAHRVKEPTKGIRTIVTETNAGIPVPESQMAREATKLVGAATNSQIFPAGVSTRPTRLRVRCAEGNGTRGI